MLFSEFLDTGDFFVMVKNGLSISDCHAASCNYRVGVFVIHYFSLAASPGSELGCGAVS